MNRLLGIGAVAAVVVGFLSFKKGKMDFKLAADELIGNCAMCGGFGYFKVEDLPVGPRWFCTEKHFAEYTGLPVKESGYYGLDPIEYEDSGDEPEYGLSHEELWGAEDERCGIWTKNSDSCKNPVESDGLCRTHVAKYGTKDNALAEIKKGVWEKKHSRLLERERKRRTEEKIKERETKLRKGGISTKKPKADTKQRQQETIDLLEWAKKQDFAAESFSADEEKKLQPVEKAIDTGIASGATMEGLDLALAAEGIDKDIKEYWYHFGRENWKFIPLHLYQNNRLNKSMKSCVKDWLNDEYSEDSPERMVSEFYDFNDEIPTPTDAQQKREIRHLTSVIRKIAKEMDENGEWKRYMWSPHILNDLQMRDIIHGEWDAESFSADITIKICDACEEQTDWTIIECKECGAENCVQCLDDSQVGWIDECCRIHWRAGNYDAEEDRYMRDCEDCGGDRIWCGGCGNCMGCGECYCAYAAEEGKPNLCKECGYDGEYGEEYTFCTITKDPLKPCSPKCKWEYDTNPFWNEDLCSHCWKLQQTYCEGCGDRRKDHWSDKTDVDLGWISSDTLCEDCYYLRQGAEWADEHPCEHCGSTDIDYGNNWKCHDCGRYAAEENPHSVYYWVKIEMEKRHPLSQSDLDQLLHMVSLNVPITDIEYGMEQAEQWGDEPTYIILQLAHQKAKFIEKWEADYPITRPNCKCGATLEWDNMRKAWYCIKCPFNTFSKGAESHTTSTGMAAVNGGEIDDVKEFVDMVNKLRLSAKKTDRWTGKTHPTWYQFVATVLGKEVQIKGYGTSLQIFRVDGVNHGGSSDISVKKFKEELERPWLQAETFSAEEQWMCWECGDKYPVSQPPTKIVNDSKDPYGSKGITGSFCSNCSKGAETWFDNMGDSIYSRKNHRNIRFNPFTGQEEKDPQLEESIKRTKMSALRTGLALTTFTIVMWNVWTNKKQEKDIADIMAEI